MGTFERYLSVWVLLCILAGLVLGVLIPDIFGLIAGYEIAQVNLVVGVLIWAMIFPMMTQVDLPSLKRATREPKGLIITLVVNWLIKPFSMFGLGYVFFFVFFKNWISPQDANQYLAGLILLGVAPCTAMVFVWSQLTRGDASYTLLQVSLNDVILIFAFAPIAALLLGLTDITVPWQTLVLSVVLYVVIPLIMGWIARHWSLSKGGAPALQRLQERIKPMGMIGLCLTVVLLFGFQANAIIKQPMAMVLIAVPLVIQTYFIFVIAFIAAYLWRLRPQIAAPACLIGTSNFFELAVAVAIGLFGLSSGAALATVVGVLVEVPVMLSLVALMNRLSPRLEARSTAR
ncbi:ACR3 family arsenite efflux transporter [Aliidiomarina celeris]|uniref:ACR3 family arsenite efflux transporter n=1 Tax=Aliidiomarina celeris TaxID=2249428 RepID=UPI000DE89CAD|nr:ACR3 family arsenite efflux transporter [Aliidiomarina celeris]